jgi:hypothetical protein
MKRAALLLLCILPLVGCGKIREKLAGKAIETGTGGDVKISSGGATVHDSKGGGTVSMGTDAKLPDDWPSNVPLYGGAKITAAMASPNGKTVMFETKDPPAKVADFYKEKLASLTKVTELDLGGTTRQLVFRDGKKTVQLSITGAGPSTTVSLSIAGQ